MWKSPSTVVPKTLSELEISFFLLRDAIHSSLFVNHLGIEVSLRLYRMAKCTEVTFCIQHLKPFKGCSWFHKLLSSRSGHKTSLWAHTEDVGCSCYGPISNGKACTWWRKQHDERHRCLLFPRHKATTGEGKHPNEPKESPKGSNSKQKK